METGDPKQLAILAVMAVGALGFLVTRLGGRHEASTQARAGAERAAGARVETRFNVARDPFSHPRLAPKETRPAVIPTFVAEAKKLPSFSLVGSLPSAPAGVAAPLAPLPAAKESGKESPPPAPPASTTIGLEAVAGASEAVAFLTVGDAESQPFHPHQLVAGAIRLLSIGDGEIVLSGPKGKLTLGVGERKTL